MRIHGRESVRRWRWFPDRNLTVPGESAALGDRGAVVVPPVARAVPGALPPALDFGSVPLPTGTLSGRTGSSEHFVHTSCDDERIALLQTERPHCHLPFIHERGVDVHGG